MASLMTGTDADTDSDVDMGWLALAIAASTVVLNKKRKKRKWVREWIAKRSKLGAYSSLLKELSCQDPAALKNFLRMDQHTFENLLSLVGSRLEKKDTRMRESIKPGERLAITLRYLAEGCSFKELMYLYRVPDNTVSLIVHETCKAIYDALHPVYLQMPKTAEEWTQIATDFEKRWNFNNCIGAIDGKHVAIVSPGEGSVYWNYKGYHSIILLALVDAHYRFLYVDVGANGRAGDAGVFRNSSLSTNLEGNLIDIPMPKALPGRQKEMPYVIVGDDAFPLKDNLLKPYPSRTNMQADQEVERKKIRIFNYRLSRARRVSENAFGILSNRFGVFRKPMYLKPDRATDVTLAAICLHNFLCKRKDSTYRPARLDDLNTDSFTPLERNQRNRSANSAREIRDEFKQFFSNEGRVSWQDKIAL